MRDGRGASPHEHLYHIWDRHRPSLASAWSISRGPYKLVRGKETTLIPAEKVLFAGDSREAVRRYLLTQATETSKSAPKFTGYNSEATRTFTGQLQPLLMNLCVNCHGKPDHDSGYKLTRIPEGYADPAATRRNLESTLNFVTPGDIRNSPLLQKAFVAHGGQKQPALRSRQILAAQNLEKWLYWATLPEGSAYPAVVPLQSARQPAVTLKKPINSPPVTLPTSEDPFDPQLFNQLAHPTGSSKSSR